MSKTLQTKFLVNDMIDLIDDSYLFEYIFEACEYFKNWGYICNASEIYAIAGQMDEIDIKRLLKTTLVHSSEEYELFNDIYNNFIDVYFHKQKEKERLKNAFKNKNHQKNEQMKGLAAKKNDLEKQIETCDGGETAKKAEVMEAQQKGLPNLKECLSETDYLKNFASKLSKGDIPHHTQLMDEIKDALKKACLQNNSKDVMNAIKDRGNLLKAATDPRIAIRKELKSINQDIKDIEEEMKETDRKFRKQMDEIIKSYSISHRKQFNKETAKNAVKSTYIGDTCLDKNFSKMSDAEKKKISNYIKDNTQKFRTKLSRKVRTNNSNKIDMPSTIKKSCQTGGVPLHLIHVKPVRQKANLILILDVSGSCKNASEMMLVFMHAMKEAFPGGCRTYAFTNRLYDISDFFDTNLAAQKVLETIPRAGAYSNYEIPFKTFCEEHLHEVTGSSYVYIIGDARNCKNKSGEEYVKAIARKAKKTFWLNTENELKWDTGDSIMSTYAKYMTSVIQTETPGELLGFMEEM